MITRLESKDFDKVYHLIEVSFPADEYRTYEEQKALLGNPNYNIYILPSENEDTIKAFIAIWEFDSFAFIEHFAVNQKYRNMGLGSKILKEIVWVLKKMVCLEVEPPHNELASRRIRFYERNNFFLNEYPYMQPAISKGRNPIPLFIMTFGRAINKDEFRTIKKDLYTKVYKQS